MFAIPELMTSAAADLSTIGSEVDAAHLVASPPTTALIPAAADEVSAGITTLFSQYANDFQALAAKASVFQGQFVGNLKASAAAYTGADAANTSLLQELNNFLGSPLGQTPLIQNIAGIALLAAWTVAVFGFLLVLVPLGIVLVPLGILLQGFIQQLGSLLP